MAREVINNKRQGNMAEVAEFILSGQNFGINGSKIKQIVPYRPEKLTKPPRQHPAVAGLYMFRDKTVPLILLGSYLGMPEDQELERRVVLVTEFNETTTAFIADQVTRIHRINWSQLKPLNEYLISKAPQIIGTFTIEGREILVLDLEQIVGEIFPDSISTYDESHFAARGGPADRPQAKIFFAEDSYIIRTQLIKMLAAAGYSDVTAFGNGRDAFEALRAAAKRADEQGTPLKDLAAVLITDIEMPQMDGLVLCEKLKHELKLELPVIIFSSLINEQLEAKCRRAGAEAWVSKPQTHRLIELVDQLALGIKPEESAD